MGFIDSITSRAASTLRSVENRAETAVKSVEAKVDSAVQTVEAKVSNLAHSAESTFTAAKTDVKKTAEKLGQALGTAHNSGGPTIQAKDLRANLTAGTATVRDADNKPVKIATSATGPVPADSWNHPADLLKNLSQYNASNVRAGADNCGPSGALAAAIMTSPAATSKLLKSVANDSANQLSTQDRARLNELAGKVDNKSIKFEELNEAQGLIYKGNKPPNAGTGLSLGEVQQMNAKHLAGADSTLPTAGNPPKANLGAVMDGLKPGQSAVVLIAGVAGTQDMDHYVTLGKSADGKPYVYNPDPDLTGGDKVMVTGDDAKKALAHYSKRMFPSTQPGFVGQFPKVTTVTPPA